MIVKRVKRRGGKYKQIFMGSICGGIVNHGYFGRK